MKNKFMIYPDRDSNIIRKIINSNFSENYWRVSEGLIFDEIKSKIFKMKNSMSLFDVGCGDGRLFKEFSKYFNQIIGIEPDKEQFQKAKNLVMKNNLDNIDLYNIPFENLEINLKADVILCSHVIQHISSEKILNIFDNFCKFLKPNGVIFLLTTHSKDKDFFTINFLKNGILYEKFIDENSFNNNSNILGKLQTHFFSRETMKKLIDNNGFIIDSYRFYHFNTILTKFLNPKKLDMIFNKFDVLNMHFGRDVLYCLKLNIAKKHKSLSG